MRILVLFGSKSDQSTYQPFLAQLEKSHMVQFDIISAHRNPVKLEKTLNQASYDAVVAGAGLAAHLPGVIASKTNKPVFGIPVEASFGGLDALCSIQQMPFGVPVITCAPGRAADICNFLDRLEKKEAKYLLNLNLVVKKDSLNYDHYITEIERTMIHAKEHGIDLKVTNQFDKTKTNIMLVDNNEDINNNEFCLHVPILDKRSRSIPQKYLEIFEWVKQGGLWVGVNNTRNAILSMLKLSKYFESRKGVEYATSHFI